jgi:hypothetical protein
VTISPQGSVADGHAVVGSGFLEDLATVNKARREQFPDFMRRFLLGDG